MPIQYHRLIPRYTRWRLSEDGVLAEECLKYCRISHGFLLRCCGHIFFLSEKQKWLLFLSAPKCLLPRQLGCPLMLLHSGAICSCITHAYEGSGWYATSEGKSWVPSLLPPDWVERSSPSRAGELPPLAVHSGKGCGSSLLLFHTVGAGPSITPGQLFWQNRGKQCSSGNGNDLGIVAGRGIWMLTAGTSKERLQWT